MDVESCLRRRRLLLVGARAWRLRRRALRQCRPRRSSAADAAIGGAGHRSPRLRPARRRPTPAIDHRDATGRRRSTASRCGPPTASTPPRRTRSTSSRKNGARLRRPQRDRLCRQGPRLRRPLRRKDVADPRPARTATGCSTTRRPTSSPWSPRTARRAPCSSRADGASLLGPAEGRVQADGGDRDAGGCGAADQLRLAQSRRAIRASRRRARRRGEGQADAGAEGEHQARSCGRPVSAILGRDRSAGSAERARPRGVAGLGRSRGRRPARVRA